MPMSWCRMIGRVASRSAPSASSAIGEVTAYWCSVGSIGSVSPTVFAIAGPHTPAQQTTTSASIVSPVVVRTPRTAPRSVMISETAVSPTKRAPPSAARAACASTARSAAASPSPSVAYAPSRPSRSIVGHAAIASSGPIIRPRHPNARAAPHRRHSSASRSSEYATSSVPTGSSAGPPVVARLAYFRTVASAVSVMNRDVLVRLIKPGACDDEPPVANSGPLSTTVTSGSPRSTSSSASAAPTTPAPMITKRRCIIRSPVRGFQDGSCDAAGLVQPLAVHEHVGVTFQEGEQPAARRLHPPDDAGRLERLADLVRVLGRARTQVNRLDPDRDVPDPTHPPTLPLGRTNGFETPAALRLDPLAPRVVHRLERHGDGIARADDVGLPRSGQQEVVGDVFFALDHREADRAAERVAVRAVPHLARVFAVVVQLFVAVEERLRVADQHLHHPRGPDAGVTLLDHRLLADEPARLVPRDREVDPRLEQRVAVVDVDGVVAIRLLEAKRVQREQPGVPDREIFARLDERVVDGDRLVARHVQLPAELAQIGHADRVGEAHPDLDVLGAHVRERLVRQVRGREARQELARLRSLHGEQHPR